MPATRRNGLAKFLAVAKPFFQSEKRWLGIGLFSLEVVLMLVVTGLMVVANYMNGDTMTAVAHRDGGAFFRFLLLWAGVFVLATVVAVFKQFTEDNLAIRWREWLTRHLVSRYLSRHAYYRMKARADLDNPDQRITEDVKNFTIGTLSIVFILLNGVVQLCAFSSILWSISPWLFLAAAGYAVFGTGMTVLFGYRLIGLDVRQQRKEADFRYELIRVRENAEPVALLRGEAQENARLRGRLGRLVDNFKVMIVLNRNLAFFTIGYTYMIQVIPVLISAPLYIQGVIEFGMITQAAAAFDVVLRAFAVVVTEFQRIIQFAAVVERLSSFSEALDEHAPAESADAAGVPAVTVAPARYAKSAIETEEDDVRLAYDRLTLVTPDEGRLLIEDLTLEVPPGRRVLIMGPDGSGRTTLLRATAGLWRAGQGRITRPALKDVMFLPQQPYLTAGTLREQLRYGVPREDVSDEEIRDTLREVGFGPVLERVGGLDAERDWPHILPLSEQLLVAFTRLLLARPRYAFLDEATGCLDAERGQALYEALSRTPITYVSVATDPGLLEYHDVLLELHGNGAWTAVPRLQAASA